MLSVRSCFKLKATSQIGIVCILFIFCSLHHASTSEEPSTTTTTTTTSPPIALQDIGYDSTWEKFCDPEQIDKDFAFYLEHEMRTLRSLICDMKAENLISLDTMSPFIAYKFCELTRFHVNNFLERLVTQIADNDQQKKRILLTESSTSGGTSACFTTALNAFEKKCIDEKNPYFRMFKPILARACDLTKTETILSSMDEVCTNRMSDNIDWPAIIRTVPYRGPIKN